MGKNFGSKQFKGELKAAMQTAATEDGHVKPKQKYLQNYFIKADTVLDISCSWGSQFHWASVFGYGQ